MFLIPNLNCDLCCHRDSSQVGVKVGGQGQGWDQERVPKVGKSLNFRGLNASIFLIFFFDTPTISRGFHFFAVEHPKMKAKGRTARTTAGRTVCMNTGRVVSHSKQYKQEIDPF